MIIQACKPNREDQEFNLKIRLAEEPDCIHPILSQSGIAPQIEALIMPALFEYYGPEMKLTPILVKELGSAISNTDSSISYQYEFLDGATWDNGKALSTIDLEFTLKAAMNPYISNNTWRGFIKNIVSLESSVNDPQRFQITVKKGYIFSREISGSYNLYPEYFYDASHLLRSFTLHDLIHKDSASFTEQEHQLLRKHADLFQSDSFCKHSIHGAGAYRLVSWQAGSKIILEKKNDWWGQKYQDQFISLKAYPDRIEYWILPDELTALNAIKDGSIDLTANINPNQFIALKSESSSSNSLQFATPILMQYYFIEINHRRPGLEDVRVRRALAHLLDLDGFIKNHMQGLAQRSIGPVHPSLPYYNANIKAPTYDPNEAKKLLAEAGWSDSNGDGILDKTSQGKFTSLSFKLLVSGKELGKNLGTLLKEEAKKVGIQIELENKDWSLILKDFNSRNFDLATAVSSQAPSLWDPYQSWHSSNAGVGGSNRGGFGNVETDRLIELIRTTSDEKARKEAYLKFQEILAKEQAQIFLFTPLGRMVYNHRITLQAHSLKPGYTEALIQINQ